MYNPILELEKCKSLHLCDAAPRNRGPAEPRGGGWRLVTRLYSILDSGVHSTSSSTNTTVQFDGGAVEAPPGNALTGSLPRTRDWHAALLPLPAASSIPLKYPGTSGYLVVSGYLGIYHRVPGSFHRCYL